MLEPVFRLLLDTASRLRPCLSIVMFHRVLAQPDVLRPADLSAAAFDLRLTWMQRNFHVMTLRDAVAAMDERKLPPRALCITFDDGYADNAEIALPLLRQRGLAATFFVTTRYLDGGMMWNDRVIEAVQAWPGERIDLNGEGLGVHDLRGDRAAALETLVQRLKYLDYGTRETIASQLLADSGSTTSRLMMSADQVRSLHQAGMEIGGHTDSHPIMARLDDDAARVEVRVNKECLERITGTEVTSFAYPNGHANRDYHGRHPRLLQELGYRCAVTTMPGCAVDLQRRYEIPRFTPWDTTATRFVARMGLNYLTRPRYADAVA